MRQQDHGPRWLWLALKWHNNGTTGSVNADRTSLAGSGADHTEAQQITQVPEAPKPGVRALIKEALQDGSDRGWIARTMVALDGDGSLRLGLDAPRARRLMRITAELDDVPSARRKKIINKTMYEHFRG